MSAMAPEGLGAVSPERQGCFFSCFQCLPKRVDGAYYGEILPPPTPCSIQLLEEADLSNTSPTDMAGIQDDTKPVQFRKDSMCSTDVSSQVADADSLEVMTQSSRTPLPTLLPPFPAGKSGHAVLPVKSSSCRSATVVRTESQESTPATRRKRDALRRMSRKMTARMTKRFGSLSGYRKQSTLFTASRRIPSPLVPTTTPLSSHRLEEVTLASVRGALMRIEGCPMIKFLKQVAGCYDFVSTAWEDCSEVLGSQVRKCTYMTPVPDSLPGFARRLLNVPEKISTSTVWRLRQDGEELVLLQHSYTRDVLYGDRFKVQNASRFHKDEDSNCVILDQWMEIVWDKPLPWTHGVVRHFIEAKARSDALAFSADLARCIEEAAEMLPPGWDGSTSTVS